MKDLKKRVEELQMCIKVGSTESTDARLRMIAIRCLFEKTCQVSQGDL